MHRSIPCLLLIVLAGTVLAHHPALALEESGTSSQCATNPAVPAVPGNAQVFRSSEPASADAAEPIQRVLDHLQSGDSLVFAPGTYRIGKALVVHTAGVTLFGNGATLFFTNATEGGITVRSDDVAIYGLTLDQDSKERQSTPWSGGIAIYDDENHVVRRVRGSIIQGNTIKNAAAAGIFVYSADFFTVAQNTVWRSFADGIHVTAGSSNGRIIDNKVSQTGDDMIAVVSYAGSTGALRAPQRDLSRNIYIANNRVEDQYWGRGISVVGGSDITIENNFISRTPLAAGIYLVRETSYRTFGVHGVLVKANHISNIETQVSSFQRGEHAQQLTGHGAIEVGSLQDPDELNEPILRQAFSVSDVAIVTNEILHSRFAGIRLGVGAPHTVSRVLISGNAETKVGGNSVVELHPGADALTVSCRKNKLDDVFFANVCASNVAPNTKVIRVRGAVLKCSSTGTLLEQYVSKDIVN